MGVLIIGRWSYPGERRVAGPRRDTQPTLSLQPRIPLRLTEDWRVISRSNVSIIHVPGPEETTGLGTSTSPFSWRRPTRRSGSGAPVPSSNPDRDPHSVGHGEVVRRTDGGTSLRSPRVGAQHAALVALL